MALSSTSQQADSSACCSEAYEANMPGCRDCPASPPAHHAAPPSQATRVLLRRPCSADGTDATATTLGFSHTNTRVPAGTVNVPVSAPGQPDRLAVRCRSQPASPSDAGQQEVVDQHPGRQLVADHPEFLPDTSPSFGVGRQVGTLATTRASRSTVLAIMLPWSSPCGSSSAAEASTGSSTGAASRGNWRHTAAAAWASRSSSPLPARGSPRRASHAVATWSAMPAARSARRASSRSASTAARAAACSPGRSRCRRPRGVSCIPVGARTSAGSRGSRPGGIASPGRPAAPKAPGPVALPRPGRPASRGA